MADPSSTPFPPLILASTSRYRQALLRRLRLPFEVCSPGVDETPQAGEAPRDLALRLAQAKALAVAHQRPGSLVIGSDQVADLHGQALGKPGDHPRAVAQLRAMSGQTVTFQTAVTVARVAQAGAPPQVLVDLAAVVVRFRTLDDASIERYLRLDEPYDCAGSAKSESLGPALLDAIESDDPTALEGLPLIRTLRMLREMGLDPLQPGVTP